jgi:hypothetical protein
VSIYRKIYEDCYGPIPVDEIGRPYDIHHIDGNHRNNDIGNLIAVSVTEHYDIHYRQCDWAACLLISLRLKMLPQDISALRSLANQERVRNGAHNFLGSKLQDKRVADGTHPFLGGKIQGDASQRRLKERTHNCLFQYICPHCNKHGKGPVMMRHHFDNCKFALSGSRMTKES